MCFCFSGPPTYTPKDEVLNHPTEFIASINWIKDQQLTKEQFVYNKHRISYIRTYFIRSSFFVLLICGFYLLPDTIYKIFKLIGFNSKTISKDFIFYDLILSKVIIFTIIIFSKISIKFQNCCNTCLCLAILLFFMIYIIKEIITVT
jgi:hypothetical protein